MIEARGPNGEIHRYPDDITQEQIDADLSQHYGKKEEEPYVQPTWKDTFKQALENREPRMSQEQAETIQKGRESPGGWALDLPLYFLPGVGEAIGGEGLAARLGPRAAEFLKNILKVGGNVGQQAGIAGGLASLSDESGGKAAAETLPFSLGSELFASSSPIARLLKRGALMGLGGYAGSQVAEKTGQSKLGGTVIGSLLPSYIWRGNKGAQNIEKGAMGRFFESIFPKSEKAEVNNLYNQSYYKTAPAAKITPEFKASEAIIIPESVATKFENNEIFKDAEKEMFTGSDIRESLKSVPKESMEYWDNVKQELGKMIQQAKRGGPNNKPDLKRARSLTEFQKELVDEMSLISPKYKEATALSQRQIARRQFENFLEKAKGGATGENFAKYLQTPEKYAKLQDSLGKVPEAQAQLEVLKSAFDKLKGIKPSEGIKGRANPYNNLVKTYHYDSAMKELASNPVWKEELNNLMKISDKHKFINHMTDLLAKAGSFSLTTPAQPFEDTKTLSSYLGDQLKSTGLFSRNVQ